MKASILFQYITFLCISMSLLACNGNGSGKDTKKESAEIEPVFHNKPGSSDTLHLTPTPYGTLLSKNINGHEVYMPDFILGSTPGYIEGDYNYYNIFIEIDNKPVFCSHNLNKQEKEYQQQLFSGTKFGNGSLDIARLIQDAIDGDPESWRLLSHICYDAYIQAIRMTGLQMIGVDFDNNKVWTMKRADGDSYVFDYRSISDFLKQSPVHVILIDGIIRELSTDCISMINRDSWSADLPKQISEITHKNLTTIKNDLRKNGYKDK